MTKSNRERKAVYVRKFTLDELGIEPPEHIKQLKNPRKHICLEDFKSQIGILINSFSGLSNMIGNPEDYENSKQFEMFYNQVFIARSFVIQYFVVLDHAIDKLLFHHQSDLGIESDKIENYSEVEIGLKKYIPQSERTTKFSSLHTSITHFRNLRNQFSHYPHGLFSLGANRESFESFLEKLKGIQTDPERGYHCYINGKAGFILPYSTNSGEYINDLIETGGNFYMMLTDIFLLDHD